MILTAQNYYSQEANWAYFSVSQIKSFMECPARTMAELRGEFVRPQSPALMIGSYVDAYFEGTLDAFKEERPDLFKKNGELKAEFRHADVMIARAEADLVFMEYMVGEKQAIVTGDIDGYPFKIKMDVRHPKRIVDLKTTKDFMPVYVPGEGRMSFVEAYRYTLQGGVYRHIDGHGLPFYIAAITKEAMPDIALIEVDDARMQTEMKIMRQNLPYYDAVKRGVVEPMRCEHCAYCKATRKLTGPITLDEFEMTFFEGE